MGQALILYGRKFGERGGSTTRIDALREFARAVEEMK